MLLKWRVCTLFYTNHWSPDTHAIFVTFLIQILLTNSPVTMCDNVGAAHNNEIINSH